MIRRLLTLLVLSGCSFAAVTTVTGSVKDLSGSAINSKVKIRAWLRGCAGNQPRVLGVASLVPTQGVTWYFDFTPDASGNVSGQLYSNDVDIDCGGVTGVTWYGIQIYYNGIPGPESPANAVSGGTLNVTNFTPITVIPVVPAPTGDTTYLRTDGGNAPGSITLNTNIHGVTLTSPSIVGNPSSNGNWSFGSIQAIQMADLASGGSVGAKIDQACTNLSGVPGVIWIPSTMGAGNSLVGLPDNCHVMDFRAINGPNEFGQEGVAILKQILMRARWTTAPVSNQNYSVLQLKSAAFSGGTNASGGPKTNYAALQVSAENRTPGQHPGINAQVVNTSGQGDTTVLTGQATSWGRNNAGGDEGVEGVTVTVNQGSQVMTGTVGSIVSNTVNFSSTVNPFTLGEQRPLINTSRNVYTTGTVTGISGQPPIVVGSGTNWAVQFGTGAKSNLFFSLDADANGAIKLVVPVRSITDATHLVLDYVSEGADAGYPTTSTGSYHIFQGSNVTSLVYAPSATFTAVNVSDGTQFSISDSVEQPVSYAIAMNGAHFSLFPMLACGSNTGCHGITIDGIIPSQVNTTSDPTAIFVNTPNWAHLIRFTSGSSTGAAIQFVGFPVGLNGAGPIIDYQDATTNTLVSLFRTLNNASAARNFQYSRGDDSWIFAPSVTEIFADGHMHVQSAFDSGTSVTASTTVTAGSGFVSGASTGGTQVVNVRNSTNTGACTITYSGGLFISTTCP